MTSHPRSFLVLSLILCVPGYAVSTPLLGRNILPLGSDTEDMNEAVPSDSCVQPPASSLNVCNLDYLIPESLAKIAAAIEVEISGYADDEPRFRSPECTAAASEIMCAQRFPECRENGGETEVILTSLDCQRILDESCGTRVSQALINQSFCDLQNSTQPASGCKTIAELESQKAEDDRMHYCGVDSQRKVTPWMYELTRFYDAQLARISGTSCFQGRADFTCKVLGQCTADGQKVEIINTYEACESFINCFPEVHMDSLRNIYDCELWPKEPTPAPTTMSSSTTSESTRFTAWPTDDNPLESMTTSASNTLYRISVASLSVSLILYILL